MLQAVVECNKVHLLKSLLNLSISILYNFILLLHYIHYKYCTFYSNTFIWQL